MTDLESRPDRNVCRAFVHDLAVLLSESRVPIEHVRDALGHAHIGMTNTYLGLRKDTLNAPTSNGRRIAHVNA